MRIYEIFCDSARSMNALRSRMVLALLGIAIGTAAVIAMLHVGHNARQEAIRLYEALGTDRIMIHASPGKEGAGTLPVEWVRDMPKNNLGVREATAIIHHGSQIRARGYDSGRATILAATQSIYSIGKARLTSGRVTYDADGFEPFTVIGSNIAQGIFEATGHMPIIGDKITARNQTLTIIGILGSVPANLFIDVDFNSSIVIPFAAARRIMNVPSITGIAASLDEGVEDKIAAAAITKYFEARMKGGSVTVRTAREIIEAKGAQMRIYGLLLLAIGSIALVVGGTGIMNVMLMNVIQRKQEIGLRRAIGARRNDIILMVLCETVILSLAGTLIGILLGVLGGWGFAVFSGWTFVIAPMTIPLGVSMALCVGLFFGLYPALKAANLDPVQALRAQG